MQYNKKYISALPERVQNNKKFSTLLLPGISA
jgi:hypothetical protein